MRKKGLDAAVKTKTNPIGPGKVNVTVNMDKAFRDSLLASANASGMTLGAYIRFILEENVEKIVERRLSSFGDKQALAAARSKTAGKGAVRG